MSDIGESLIASWLRHVMKCQIVQTNWTVDMDVKNDITTVLKEAQKDFENGIGGKMKRYNIFHDKSIDYVIKQAECDAVGIKFINKDKINYYGVDIAFHSNGLGYGNSEKNVTKIIEKSLRTALCFYNVLQIPSNASVSIIFATPKMSEEEENNANNALRELESIFNKKGYKNVEFHNYGNKNFFDEILNPLLKGDKLFKYKDYNELFIRSIQLYELSTNFVIKNTNTKKNISITLPSEDDIKVGEHARKDLIEYLDKNVTKELLSLFLDKEGTKKYFKIGYPLLMEEEPEGNYRDRYYRIPFIIRGNPYYLCNNWKDTNKKEIEDFIGNKKT